MRIAVLVAACVLAAIAPARAEWRQARTNHFVLTINDTEQGARDFATRLERFDAAMRLLYGVADHPDQHGRPIAIYALQPELFYEVCRCPGILGYYRQRPGQSLILTQHMPDIDRRSKAATGWWSSQTVLLHEYSHHFTYSNFPIAYPYWFSEGFAEFNANVTFEPDQSLIVGYPADYRGAALKSGTRLSPKQLFDPHRFGFHDNFDLVYGRGWLLTHYLILHSQRKGQLAAYLEAMNKGQGSYEAAGAVFGDLNKLNGELDSYRKGKLAAPLRIPPGNAPVQVTVTSLTPGQAEMLPVYALATDGVAKGYRLGVAMRAAKIAGRHADDASVQAQWAEVEFLAGRLDRADAAADAALRLAPEGVDALVRKGLIASRRAREANGKDPAAWKAARVWFVKANRAAPNAVLPLFYYYLSFGWANERPPQGAIRGLMRAQVLAPESIDIRTALARQMLLGDDAAAARQLLQPVAFAPHRRSDDNVPRQVVDLIDAGKVSEAKALLVASGNKKKRPDDE